MDAVKEWYDGFTFGKHTDIYNPWSIINYLDEKELAGYWVNTSSNGLVNSLMRKGDAEMKMIVEDMIRGKSFRTRIDEQIVFSQLDENNDAVWSLLLASGYLKVINIEVKETEQIKLYTLSCTNKERNRVIKADNKITKPSKMPRNRHFLCHLFSNKPGVVKN